MSVITQTTPAAAHRPPTRAERQAAEHIARGVAHDLVDPLAPGAAIRFATEPNSPFPDGYSIAGERAALIELGVTDWPDEGHPLYERYAVLDERTKQREQMEATWRARNGADALVSAGEASSMRQLGQLVSDGADQMTLHTKEAYRLFIGRAADPEKKLESIPGAKRLAHALRGLWQLTAFDNPYADWALVRHDHNIGEVLKQLESRTRDAQHSLDKVRSRGLNYTVLQSAEPKVLDLGFKSPYGYAVAELVVTYDYYVRLMKTLCRKNLISDKEEYSAIREITRTIRRHMHETNYFGRWLTTKELINLARADFLPTTSDDSRKRQEAAAAIFGPVPSQIYAGTLAPRHTRRRQNLSGPEQKLLQQVSAELQAGEAELEAEARGATEAAAGLLV